MIKAERPKPTCAEGIAHDTPASDAILQRAASDSRSQVSNLDESDSAMLVSALTILGAVLLFGVGIWLSAFFSGAETGFYRASPLRLNIDAIAGDPAAQRLQWFSRNPSHFVATTLVGNNIANYLTTVAIGLAAFELMPSFGGSAEILLTVAISPVVFIFGELIPKNLFYRAPLALLRSRATLFSAFHRVFLVVSVPLMLITKLIERFSSGSQAHHELVLGRSRLVQVLTQGHREGILTDVQSRLIQNVMMSVSDSVVQSMTPASRVLGLGINASRDELLEYARRFGLTHVAICHTEEASDWYGYVRVVDVSIVNRPPKQLVREMPKLSEKDTKLDALVKLRASAAAYGAVYHEDEFVGTVSERGLAEQLFRLPHDSVRAT